MNAPVKTYLIGLGLMLLVESCAHATHAPTGPAAGTCAARSHAGAESYTVTGAERLAGTYVLQLVVTAGTPDDRIGPYRLTLWANDSIRRETYRRDPARGRVRWRGERPLAGYLEGEELDSASVLRSRDPDEPGVTVLDSVLHLGPVDVSDGSGDLLVIRTVSTAGFWGSWRRDRGIEHDPHPTRGHFCATRIE